MYQWNYIFLTPLPSFLLSSKTRFLAFWYRQQHKFISIIKAEFYARKLHTMFHYNLILSNSFLDPNGKGPVTRKGSIKGSCIIPSLISYWLEKIFYLLHHWLWPDITQTQSQDRVLGKKLIWPDGLDYLRESYIPLTSQTINNN